MRLFPFQPQASEWHLGAGHVECESVGASPECDERGGTHWHPADTASVHVTRGAAAMSDDQRQSLLSRQSAVAFRRGAVASFEKAARAEEQTSAQGTETNLRAPGTVDTGGCGGGDRQERG